MRDVLLAEVTFKIKKKNWHINWQWKSVKFGGYIFFSPLCYNQL